MVTMPPSYWNSATTIALVVIVSANFSLVSSYCSERSDFCTAENTINRQERSISFKQERRGNEFDRTFHETLRREFATGYTRQTSNPPRRDQRTTVSNENSRQLESYLSRENFKRTSANVLREENRSGGRILDREAREERVREVKRLDHRIRKERAFEDRITNTEEASRKTRVENMDTARTRRQTNFNHSNRREMRRLAPAARSIDFTRGNINERAIEQRNMRLNEKDHQRSYDRRGISSDRDSNENRRRESLAEKRNAERYQEQSEDIHSRYTRENRKELQGRVLNTVTGNQRIGSRRLDFRMNEAETKTETVPVEARIVDRLSNIHNDYWQDTALKQLNRYSPQVTWSFCQTILVGAIILQLLKYKNDVSKSKR